jgi:hypothetical protein
MLARAHTGSGQAAVLAQRRRIERLENSLAAALAAAEAAAGAERARSTQALDQLLQARGSCSEGSTCVCVRARERESLRV